MYLTPITSINFTSHNSQKPCKQNCSRQNNNSVIEKKKAYSLVAAAAISAAAIGGIIAHHSCEKSNKALTNSIKRNYDEAIENAQRQYQQAYERWRPMFNENEQLKNIIETITKEKENLSAKNKTLKKEAENFRTKLNAIFENDLTPEDIRTKILEKLRKTINEGDYGYDITTPPVTGIKGITVYDDAIPLPEHVGTLNRVGMRPLDIPKVSSDGRFSFELPMSSEVRTVHESKNFRPVKNKESTVSLNYGNSVQWDNDKVARDLLQNFYDGHGQTLDGVRMVFTPVANGRYKVRIEGKSTFTPDKAIYLGMTSKAFNEHAAGNYGEGLKMASLKLLTDGGAQEVKIASGDWECKWFVGQSELLEGENEKVMYYTVDKTAERLNGNYLEFETNNIELLQSLRNTINRFYHSSNPDFKCPDFENNLFGLKVLPKGQKGGLYIAGQRFEFDGNYDGIDGISLFIKQKLPKEILDTSRDRVSLNSNNIECIASWLARNKEMTNDDKVKLLKSLERYWDEKNYSEMTTMDKFIGKFLRYSNWDSDIQKLHIKFPEKYIAYSNSSNELVQSLRMKGYKVCKNEFEKLGMPTIKDLMGDARAHDVIIPNDVQKKKILILKEALKKLSALEDKHFTPEELDTKIFLFDRNSARDSRLHSDALAEAIIDKEVSKGFWIDKEYLDTADFKDVLETALHELSHKVGGDESSEFSYKLTDVNREAIGQILNNADTRYELQALSDIWNSL